MCLSPVPFEQKCQIHLAEMIPKSALTSTNFKMLFISAYIEYFLQFKKVFVLKVKLTNLEMKRGKICAGGKIINQVFGK